MSIELQTGDVFCSSNPAFMGKIINRYQKFISRDDKSTYSHAGIIVKKDGTIFEAVHKNSINNLFKEYEGKKVVIARYTKFEPGYIDSIVDDLIYEFEGRKYRYHRLLLHLIPPFAKYLNIKKKNLVCSELVGEFLYRSHLFCGHEEDGYLWPRHKHSRGTNPDTLSDEWHRWKYFKIIFEGKLLKSDFNLKDTKK